MTREILTYELFGRGIRELAHQVADSDFEPDILLGIARGGLVPAGALAYALDCQNLLRGTAWGGLPAPACPPDAVDGKNLATIRVEFSPGGDAGRDVPVIRPP